MRSCFIWFMVMFCTICHGETLITIQDFNQQPLLKSGPYVIEGYIIHSYRCAPCSANTYCKSCLSPAVSITLSKDNQPQTYSEVTNDYGYMVTQLDHPEHYLLITIPSEIQWWHLPEDPPRSFFNKRWFQKQVTLHKNKKYRVTLQVKTYTDAVISGAWRATSEWYATHIELVEKD